MRTPSGPEGDLTTVYDSSQQKHLVGLLWSCPVALDVAVGLTLARQFDTCHRGRDQRHWVGGFRYPGAEQRPKAEHQVLRWRDIHGRFVNLGVLCSTFNYHQKVEAMFLLCASELAR